MRIFFSVGEPSGDLHGANLIAELRKLAAIEAVGLGGPKMHEAGCELLRDMSDLAVMGLLPVLAKLPQFLRLKKQVQRSLDAQRPDAVILIDYPGFNWHVARMAKEREIPVFYYGLPQLWAWATWRVKKVQRYVDHALCKLPFEETWFREQGCNATYVGHPYFDELSQQKLDDAFLRQIRLSGSRLITILPGSRNQEVKHNLPDLLSAAAKVLREFPDVRLAVASYNQFQAQTARQMVSQAELPVDVFIGRTPELIAAADCCLACSGSVSLELLYHAKPAVILYRVGWLLYQVVRPLMNTRYITLVNLLASQQPLRGGKGPSIAEVTDELLYPEYPTWRDCSDQIAGHAIGWLNNEESRLQLIRRLTTLRNEVAGAGASATAAEYIVQSVTGAIKDANRHLAA
jgi:lipid-A-disaccharide synthase